MINTFVPVPRPSKFNMRFEGAVVVGLLWAACVGAGVAVFPWALDPDGSMEAWVFWGCCVVALAAATWLTVQYGNAAYASRLLPHEEWVAACEEYSDKLGRYQRAIRSAGIPWLLSIDWSTYRGRYLVRSGESVLWMAEADMCVDEHRGQVGRHFEGFGLVVMTNKRFVFVPDGNAATWSKTWASLVGWESAESEIAIRSSSGRPKTFVLKNAGMNPIEDGNIGNDVLNLLLSSRFAG